MAKGIHNEGGSHKGLLVVGTCGVERGVQQSIVGEQVEDNAAQSFAGAEVRDRSGTVANLFTAESILLVIESERDRFNPHDIIQVMQRH